MCIYIYVYTYIYMHIYSYRYIYIYVYIGVVRGLSGYGDNGKETGSYCLRVYGIVLSRFKGDDR